MVDPIISGAGKAGAEMFKEASKELQNAQQQVSKFEELRNKMEAQDISGTNKAGQNTLQIEQTDKAKEAQATQQLNPVEQAQKTGEIPKVTDMSSLQQVVNRIKDGQNRLNNLIKESTSGKTYSPQEMLGLQAEISAITTDIQLCSKVVEQGVAGVKQMLQMQV
jgi:exonuclease VII small subunit